MNHTEQTARMLEMIRIILILQGKIKISGGYFNTLHRKRIAAGK